RTVSEYIVPETGYYRIELWGAGRGNNEGGYTKGRIYLVAGEKLYFYVGGQGMSCTSSACTTGYNGGGGSGFKKDSYRCNTGNGATDVRLVGGEWYDFESLKSRIMVAGGGAGGYTTARSRAGSAGGLSGYHAEDSDSKYSKYAGYGGTQTSGGAAGANYNSKYSPPTAGGFGYGGNGNPASTNGYGGGGGGGYYGGGGGGGLAGGAEDGGGGSSFISGYAGCIAINEDGTPKVETYSQIEDSYHYSGKIFTGTQMIDGRGYDWATNTFSQMPKPAGGYYSSAQGHTGNGYARITRVEISNNNYLTGIKLSTGSLNETFNKETNDYTMNVISDVSSITITGILEDENARILGNGTYSLNTGTNEIELEVISESGISNIYT
ncbi:MAG: hypothetical protein K2I72_00565, partial [Bacilli bacterium]|nr:hypothetical protein [Bacilli bacterium]